MEALPPGVLPSETKPSIWGVSGCWLLLSLLLLEKDSNKRKGSEASQKTVMDPESSLNECPMCPRPTLSHNIYSEPTACVLENQDFLSQSARFHLAPLLALLQTQPHPVGSAETQTRLTQSEGS